MSNWFTKNSAAESPVQRIRILNVTRNTTLAVAVEVADSAARRSKGLLGRTGLEPGTGLWIVPCEAVHTFWMQFPIDLVYIDRGLRVQKVRHSVGPWRMSACLSAHSIIELAPGVVRESQTQAGDTLEFFPVSTIDATDTPSNP